MNQGIETRSGHGKVKSSSERSFGIVFAVVFAIIGIFPLVGNWTAWTEIRSWSLAIAAVFLILAFVRPTLLRPANRLWFQFGMLLNRIVSPIVMAFLFWVVLSPIAIARRIRNRDPLHTRFDPETDTYWISRDPENPESGMENQF
jgi:large-conductance mechanosensitive channel